MVTSPMATVGRAKSQLSFGLSPPLSPQAALAEDAEGEPQAERPVTAETQDSEDEKSEAGSGDGSAGKVDAEKDGGEAQDAEATEDPDDAQVTPPREQPNALQVLQEAAVEHLVNKSSLQSTAPRKNLVDTNASFQAVKTNVQSSEDLTDADKEKVLADIIEERRRKVEELVRRQKKHAAKRRKEQQREAEKLGQTPAGQFFEEENRRRKVRELKTWLKGKNAETQMNSETQMRKTEVGSMDKLLKAASKAPYTMDKLERDTRDMRERRARIADEKRTALAQSSATMKPADRQLHRHVHHHVHYHDEDEAGDQTIQNHLPPAMYPGKMGMHQSASAFDIRMASFGAQSQVVTQGMPWRPLVHSASAGHMPAPGMAMPLPGKAMMMTPTKADPQGFDRTVAAFPAPPPGFARDYPQGVAPPYGPSGQGIPPAAMRPGMRA